MIIGINGRIRSGKDTVGKIIQYLVAKSFAKDPKTIAAFEKQGIGDQYNYESISGFKNVKFAGKLKQIAAILLGDPTFVQKWESGDDQFRNEFLPEWGMSRRQFLLDLGTKAMRDHFHINVHVISTFADYKPQVKADGYATAEKYPNWLITDMRFPNELDGVDDLGGTLIRVKRPLHLCWPDQWERFYISAKQSSILHFIDWLQKNDPKVYGIITHPSETSLDGFQFPYEINNDGTLAELIEKVQTILQAEKII